MSDAIPAPRPTANTALKGMGFMAVAAAMLTTNHALVRELAGALHAFEVTFFRNLFALVVLLPVILRTRLRVYRTEHLGGHFMRAVYNAGFMLCFFFALGTMPLAETTALSFTGPVFAAIGASLVFGERLGRAGVASLVLCFAGVLVLTRPGMEAVSLGALLVLASSVFYAAVMITMKSLAATDDSLTITVYAATFLVPLTAPAALAVWEWPQGSEWGLLLAMGVVATVGQLALAQSFRLAEASVVVPVDFSRLIWASLIGVAWFGDVVTVPMLVGGALVFLGNLTIVLARRRRTA